MLNEIGLRAKKAEKVLATAGTEIKNKALIAIADALMARAEYILEANKRASVAKIQVFILQLSFSSG